MGTHLRTRTDGLDGVRRVAPLTDPVARYTGWDTAQGGAMSARPAYGNPQIIFRVTPAERDQLRAVAQQRGQSVSDLVREAVRLYAGITPPTEERQKAS